MSALGRVVRGLAALASLVALLAGVPWALWHFIGWPLPHALPTWEQVSQALNSNGISDELLFNSLAVVCWAAWAALAVSVAAEVPAAIRGVTARRVPLTGPMQTVARHLVAAALLLLPPISPRPAAAASPPPITWATTARPVSTPAIPLHGPGVGVLHAIEIPTRSMSHSEATSALAADAELPRHRVAPKETLWGLAERYLGDPLRWKEIFDLNQGRPQPNGDQLIDEDLIRPGWVLLLPADALVPTVPPEAPASGPGSNGSAQHDTAGPSGQEGTASRPSQSPPPSVPPHRPSREQPATSASPQQPEDRHSPSPVVRLPLGGVVGLSLALAVSAALAAARLHRRRQWQPAEPAPGLNHDDPLVTDTIRRLLRAARSASQQGDDAADDENEQQTSTVVERPAPPITPSAFGVVTVGHRGGHEITLDLPATGGLALTGPGALAAARALVVTALARNPEAPVEVVVAGADLIQDLLPRVGAVPGLVIVADLDAALRRLEVEALYRARLLDDADTSTIGEFRKNHPTEPLPLLLLVTSTAPPILAGRLGALLDSGQRLGIGAVILGEGRGISELAVDTEGGVTEAPAGPGPFDELRDAYMMMLHPDQGQEALALVAASHGEPPVPLSTDSTQAATAIPTPTEPGDDPAPAAPTPASIVRSAAMLRLVSDEPRPVLVRLLGPIRVEANGAEIRKGLRGKAREFLTLLLIHPEGVDAEVAVETLWPDVPPPRGAERFQTTLSNLRKTLRTATGLEKAIVVAYAAGRYQLQLDLIECDL